MNPFIFGSGQRRLFGLYTPAQGRSRSAARALVLCQPWGQEYVRAHRSMRHLSVLMARAGLHALRFDYYGTGDSGGDMPDGDLDGWRDDIETAIDELKDTTGAERVGLVGLRLGGTLAAAVATRRDDVDELVLWDPIVSGQEYLRELHALASPTIAGGPTEVLGFVLTETLARQLRTLELAPHAPGLPERTFSVITAPSSVDALCGALGRRDAVEPIASAPAWIQDVNTGVEAIPVKVLQRIVEWLA